jgi:hypothetical protein
MSTAFQRAVAEANKRFDPRIEPIGAVLVRRTGEADKLARYVFRYFGFELRIELRDKVPGGDHYVFWAGLATGPLHLRVVTLVDEIVGPGGVSNLGQAMNLVRLALLRRRDLNRAIDRELGGFSVRGI